MKSIAKRLSTILILLFASLAFSTLFAQNGHDIRIEKLAMIPQFPSVGDQVEVAIEVSNQGAHDEHSIVLRVFAYGTDDTLYQVIPEILAQSRYVVNLPWTIEKTFGRGRIFIHAAVEPVEGETDVSNNGLDYANTTNRDFIADAPWRVEGNQIPFLFLIADAGSYLGFLNTTLDAISIFDENNGGILVRNYDFGGEILGDDPSEEVYWAYEAFVPVASFVTPQNEVHAMVEFFINGTNVQKHLRIKCQSSTLPHFDNWYIGDTHFHSIYSRASADQGLYDVEFGAPAFAIHDALDAIGLDWVTITDHSCYLDEEPFIWEYTVDGNPTNIMGNLSLNRWQNLRNELTSLNAAHQDFCFIMGEEITIEGTTLSNSPPNCMTLHYLLYDTTYIEAGNTGASLIYGEFPASVNLAEVCNLTQTNGGFSYAAHPNNAISTLINGAKWASSDYQVAMPYSSFKGLEIWNERITVDAAPDANNPFSYWETHPWTPEQTYAELDEGKAVWDSLLCVGLDNPIPGEDLPRKVFIEGGSDAHGDFNYMFYYSGISVAADNNAAGKVRTLAYCPDGLSVGNVKTALSEGHTIISDGPVIVFGIDLNNDGVLEWPDDILIGDDREISASQLNTARIIIERQTTDEFGAIEVFNLYRGSSLTLQDPDSFDFTVPQPNPLILDLDQYISEDDTTYIYLRVDAVSRTSELEEFRCYTNPIWIRVSPSNAPAPVAALWIWTLGSDVYLDWDDAPLASYYNVYRSENPYFTPNPGNFLDSTASSDYVDVDALNAPGARFFYVVTAAN
jgi:hypothetical protein